MEQGQVEKAKWLVKMLDCFPSREALEGIEFIRREGRYNMMMEARKVVQRLQEIGAVDTLDWIRRCSQHGFHPGTAYQYHHSRMVEEYGDVDLWLSRKRYNEFKRQSNVLKRMQLERELAELDKELDEED